MMPLQFPPKVFFKILGRVELLAAYGQGKGYGVMTTRQEAKLLNSLLPGPPSLAIDVGGNVGNYTAELLRLTSQLEVHIFEPSPMNLSKLSSRFGNEPRITLVPFALSDRSAEATLFSDSPGSGLGSLTKRRLDHFNISFEAKESVKTLRFEDYWRTTLRSRPLDIVKIDIEGHELSALSGFGAAIDATRALQFEIGGSNIDTHSYFQDFWYFFKEHHFDIYRVTPFGAERITRYKESDECFLTTNYIAVRSRTAAP